MESPREAQTARGIETVTGVNVDKTATPARTATRKEKFMTFSLGGRRYGLPLARVKEVTSFIQPTRLPSVPRHFVGLINLRGQVISVIDLAMKFGVGEVALKPQKTCVIISSIGDRQFGFLVDEVHEVLSYSPDAMAMARESGAAGIKHRGIGSIAKDADGTLTPLIDLDNALDQAELQLFLESVNEAI
ncbi:chemotaxis protein CheW [bacterium]|nr:chemotaxis protein CheW [bacterium]